MKLDTWQVRLAIKELKTAAFTRRELVPMWASLRGRLAAHVDAKALESMAAALESGESLEVGP